MPDTDNLDDDLEEIQNVFPETQENDFDEINVFEQIDETDFLNIRQGLENDVPFQAKLRNSKIHFLFVYFSKIQFYSSIPQIVHFRFWLKILSFTKHG